jgi:transposase
VQHRYEWLYLNGFVQPQTGATCWWLLPTVRIDIFSQMLAAFAREVGAGPDKLVLLVLDRAGWHTSDQVQVPEGILLVCLPPSSPELQPAERLWPLTNTPLVNRWFTSLDDLIAVQSERCRVVHAQPERIRRDTHYHWWPLIL